MESTSYVSNFIVLNSVERVTCAVEGVKQLLQEVSFCLAEDMANDLKTAILYLQRTYLDFGNNRKSRAEFRDAFKRHQKRVSEIASELIANSVTNKVSNPVQLVTRNKVIFWDGFELDEFKIQPRSFWRAYRLFRYVINCENAMQLKAVLQVITTLFGMCKDFRLLPDEMDADVLGQIEEIQNPNVNAVRSTDIDWSTEILNTLELITQSVKGEYNWRRDPIIRSFVASMLWWIRNFERPVLEPGTLKRSSASSGMTLEGFGTIPANIASMLEPELDSEFDYSNFDTLSGYLSRRPDKKDLPTNIKYCRNKCTSIEQKKWSMRLIHILANQFQDRLFYFEMVRKPFLKRLPEDATFSQEDGALETIKWMHDPRIRVIDSLDLHAATNTLSLQWQGKVTEYHLRWLGYTEEEISILMETWFHIMKFDTVIELPTSRKRVRFSFNSGQPMGFSDSFFSFDELHHIVTLTVARVSKKKLLGYRIVGDDFVAALESDESQEFARLYKDCMAFLNTECNLDKGYIYNADVAGKELKIAEFAKFLVCEGQDISPIPLQALAKSDNFGMRLTLLGWLCQHNAELGRSLNTQLIQEFCCKSHEDILAVNLMSRIPIPNILHSKVSKLDLNLNFDEGDAELIFCASVAWLRQSIILDSLSELHRDPEYVPKYSDINSFKHKKLKSLVRKVFDNPEIFNLEHNKFYNWFCNQELIAIAQGISMSEVLKGLLPDADLIQVIPSLEKWSEQDFISLASLSNVLDSISDTEDERSREITSIPHEEILLYLSILEKLAVTDFSSTNHRFGSKKDQSLSGFDTERFINDTLEIGRQIGIDPYDCLCTFSQKCAEEGKRDELEQPWSTEIVDVYSDNEAQDEGSDYDPWEGILYG